MRVARNLCLYIRRSDPSCFVPDPSSFPTRHAAIRPHIFTEREIVQVLARAAKMTRRGNSPLCPEVCRLAIVVLYTAGLRRGEVVRLTLSDYDPAEQTLRIRASKFHKSRLVAMSNDAVRELEAYLRARGRLRKASLSPDAPLLVTGHGGRRAYSGAGLGNRLRVVFRQAGIRTKLGRVARTHDLRHTYAIHTLLRWYRTGVDVQAKLPALCAAMGHVSIASTAYYLSFVAPVAEAASDRFERHCHRLLTGITRDGGAR
jgi:integrase/recombinase XerD